MLTAKALEKISAEHASALIDRNNKSNDIVGGWFAGAINGELSIYRAIVKLEDTSSTPLKFVVTGGYMKPTERISYFGSEKLSREFIENATPRAREASACAGRSRTTPRPARRSMSLSVVVAQR